jgi:hypothetical protein
MPTSSAHGGASFSNPGWCESSLLLVLAGKFVSMAEHDLPFTVLAAIDLDTAQRPTLRLVTHVTCHVLHVDGVGQVIADHGHNVFRYPIGGPDALRCPVKPVADLVPTSLVTAKGPHDHHVIST